VAVGSDGYNGGSGFSGGGEGCDKGCENSGKFIMNDHRKEIFEFY
jgi:hypothetical protein